MKITAIVPVKGKSERVINKNTRKFCDTNLLELKLNHLENVSNLNKIVVSSENEDILKYAKSRNLKHKRNKYYSTSQVPMSEVYGHLAKEVNTDVIAWINVTNPLAETKFYEEAIACYKNLDHIKYDCLLSAYEMKENFFIK